MNKMLKEKQVEKINSKSEVCMEHILTSEGDKQGNINIHVAKSA